MDQDKGLHGMGIKTADTRKLLNKCCVLVLLNAFCVVSSVVVITIGDGMVILLPPTEVISQ